jgi:hypothetical protein
VCSNTKTILESSPLGNGLSNVMALPLMTRAPSTIFERAFSAPFITWMDERMPVCLLDNHHPHDLSEEIIDPAQVTTRDVTGIKIFSAAFAHPQVQGTRYYGKEVIYKERSICLSSRSWNNLSNSLGRPRRFYFMSNNNGNRSIPLALS